jgi:hypothetical protein
MSKPAVKWDSVPTLTKGMRNLGNQFNARFPHRDGTSDGALGDAAHSKEKSGHNADDTKYHNAEWEDADKTPDTRAIDVDNNLNDSHVTMQNVIDHMRKLKNLSSVVRYMIYWHTMYHVDNDFEPRAYTGPSGHEEHAHFSGARSEASDQNTTFDFQFDKLGDADMPITDTDVEKIWAAAGTDGGKRETAFQRLGNVDEKIDDVATKADLAALEERLIAAIQAK